MGISHIIKLVFWINYYTRAYYNGDKQAFSFGNNWNGRGISNSKEKMKEVKMSTNRIDLITSRESERRIRELRKRTGADNNAEVFSYALTLFAWAISEASEGKKIVSIDPKDHIMRGVDINDIFKRTRKKAHTTR